MTTSMSFSRLVRTFADSLPEAEESISRSKNQSGHDPLNYPIHINDKVSGLMSFVISGECRSKKHA